MFLTFRASSSSKPAFHININCKCSDKLPNNTDTSSKIMLKKGEPVHFFAQAARQEIMHITQVADATASPHFQEKM